MTPSGSCYPYMCIEVVHIWAQKSQPSYDIVFWHVIESDQVRDPAYQAGNIRYKQQMLGMWVT